MKPKENQIFVVAISALVMGLSILTVTNFHVYAQENKFTEELTLLNQTVTQLENEDKDAKKILFQIESIMEDKMKDNPDATDAEKRIEAAIKMVSEENFQAALDHAREAIKTLSALNN